MESITRTPSARWLLFPMRHPERNAFETIWPADAPTASGLFTARGSGWHGESMTLVEQASGIDFAKAGGLVAGIVQDARSGHVLMLGFLNEDSWAHTQSTGFVTFWSRTRGKLWMKGETSGNRLRVLSVATDCDSDALLFRVEVEGDGLVCHEGTVSCFTRPISMEAGA